MKKMMLFTMAISFSALSFSLKSAAQPSTQMSVKTQISAEVAVGKKIECLRTIYEIDGQGNQAIKDGLPKGIALDKEGKLFAIFLDRTEVQVFNSQGEFLYRFGKKGAEEGGFLLPIGIEIADNGLVFILDAQLKRVLVFSNQGKFQYEFSFMKKSADIKKSAKDKVLTREDKEPMRCTKMGLDKRNNLLFLSDGANSNIKIFSLRGDYLGLFPLDTNKAKPLSIPGKTAFDDHGRIYLLDSINGCVQVYNDQREYEFSFGKLGTCLGDFARPIAVSVNKKGNIYVLDRLLSVIQIFDPKGQVLGVIKDTESPDGLQSTDPFDMVMDNQGVIYISLQGLHCIKVLKELP